MQVSLKNKNKKKTILDKNTWKFLLKTSNCVEKNLQNRN